MAVGISEASPLSVNVAAEVNSREPGTALVDAVRRRSPEAFEEIVTRYGPRIFRLAQRITRNREDAEDVSQDSLTRAFLHMGTFRGDSRFSTWLLSIVINQSLMKLRTRRRRELHLDRPAAAEDTPFGAEVAGDDPTPEQLYSQVELRRTLASAMGELPMTSREVLRLREVEEHSIAETARMLGLSISAVKSQTLRGQQKLRRALTKRFQRSEIIIAWVMFAILVVRCSLSGAMMHAAHPLRVLSSSSNPIMTSAVNTSGTGRESRKVLEHALTERKERPIRDPRYALSRAGDRRWAED
jgi:RNA polymerase sigma-70 factor (ECF subfamily)